MAGITEKPQRDLDLQADMERKRHLQRFLRWQSTKLRPRCTKEHISIPHDDWYAKRY